MTEAIISFDYLNHNGKTARRTITVDSVEFFGKISFGYQPGWFISGYCHDKKARRSFALNRIIFKDDALGSRGLYKLLVL